MLPESPQFRHLSLSLGGTDGPAPGLTVFALDCVNPVNLPPASPLSSGLGACQIGEWRMRAGGGLIRRKTAPEP